MVNEKETFLVVLLSFSFLYLGSHCFWTVVISSTSCFSPYLSILYTHAF